MSVEFVDKQDQFVSRISGYAYASKRITSRQMRRLSNKLDKKNADFRDSGLIFRAIINQIPK